LNRIAQAAETATTAATAATAEAKTAVGAAAGAAGAVAPVFRSRFQIQSEWASGMKCTIKNSLGINTTS
jgi:hypothetical protein